MAIHRRRTWLKGAWKSNSDTRIPDYTRPVRAHEWIDRRSLARHEAVAAKLEAQPQLLEVARANLQRWLSTNSTAALREWRQLLETTPFPELLVLLRSNGDEAARLRQSSPFAGLLTPVERQSILNDYESRRA
jgi:predicted NAD/FAD-dependent oxidoreductase